MTMVNIGLNVNVRSCEVEESGRPRLAHNQKIVGSNPTFATNHCGRNGIGNVQQNPNINGECVVSTH